MSGKILWANSIWIFTNAKYYRKLKKKNTNAFYVLIDAILYNINIKENSFR